MPDATTPAHDGHHGDDGHTGQGGHDGHDGHGLDDLYDIARLAERLGVEHATIRVWLSRKVPWLPPPDGRLNGGAVWRAQTLAGLEDRRRPGRPGPKPRVSTLLPIGPVTGGIPVIPDPCAEDGRVATGSSLSDGVTGNGRSGAVTGDGSLVPTRGGLPEGGD